MIDIDIRSDLKNLQYQFRDLKPEKFKQGISRAINHTLGKAKTEANREIRRVYNLKANIVRERLEAVNSNRLNLTGTIKANPSLIGVRHFGARQNKKGVSVKILGQGSRKTIRGAFMADMPNGGFGVFGRGEARNNQFVFRHKREIKATKGKKVNGKWRPEKNDLTINNIKTVSIYGAFINKTVLNTLSKRVSEDFGKRAEHELNRMLSKGR